MKRIAALLTLSINALAQLPQPDPIFTVKTAPITMQVGASVKSGVIITFHSDAADTTAFYAEVSYKLAGSSQIVWAQTFCMRNYNGNGTAFLWVGDISESAANGWEIKTWGKRAVTDPPPHF